MTGALNSRVNVVVDNGIGLWVAIEYDILSMKTHYVNVSVLIKFSQKTSVFTLRRSAANEKIFKLFFLHPFLASTIYITTQLKTNLI